MAEVERPFGCVVRPKVTSETESFASTVLLYGAETWPLKKTEERLLCRKEMRMLRWAQGVSLKEHKKNEEVWQQAGVECIEEKLRDARLRWIGHVERRELEHHLRRAVELPEAGKRKRGRPAKRRIDVVEEDLRRGMKKEDANNRKKWRQLLTSRPTPQ